MADTKISGLTEDTAPTGGNYFVEVDDTGGTPTTMRINGHRFVEMGERNYKFVVSVSAGNLTIALKNLAGNDFSATDPLVIKIGNAWRTVTGALSVTVNAGTNSFDAGSASTATKEIDYFVYIGYRTASTTVVVGIARFPWARVYSDFSATATAKKYGAFSTAPASTDDVINAGRIAATLSAGAGYTWTSTSQSAPTTVNTVSHPVFETRPMSFIGSKAASTLVSGSGTITTATCLGTYIIKGSREVVFSSANTITTNGTGATSIILTLPWDGGAGNGGYGYTLAGQRANDNKSLVAVINASGTTVTMVLYDGTYPAADGYILVIGGTYAAA